ncbi:embryonic protein UVS.2-like [Glandiceps talaboti]
MLKFNYFETDSQRDYVHVYNGDTAVEEQLIDSFSGTTSKPPVVFSSGATLLLVLETDSSTVKAGFYATYSTIPNGNTIGQCGGTYTSSTGVITSPLYPKDHDHNQDCAYAISTSTGNVIEVSRL